MRRRKSKIDDRLEIYGPATCPICGDYKESVFAGRYQLVCRRHPGHPLYREAGKHERVLESA